MRFNTRPAHPGLRYKGASPLMNPGSGGEGKEAARWNENAETASIISRVYRMSCVINGTGAISDVGQTESAPCISRGVMAHGSLHIRRWVWAAVSNLRK